MTNTYQVITSTSGVSISRSDGAWIPKDLANSDYRQYLEDVTQAVANQSELDAIAKAQADAKAQVDAQKASEVAFAAQLAATNQKLMALGLTATDIETLLSAAKG